jgi:hypothetical protein
LASRTVKFTAQDRAQMWGRIVLHLASQSIWRQQAPSTLVTSVRQRVNESQQRVASPKHTNKSHHVTLEDYLQNCRLESVQHWHPGLSSSQRKIELKCGVYISAEIPLHCCLSTLQSASEVKLQKNGDWPKLSEYHQHVVVSSSVILVFLEGWSYGFA